MNYPSNMKIWDLTSSMQFSNPRRFYNDYNLYVDFKAGVTPADKVSKDVMQTTGLASGRVSYYGGPYGVNEPAIDENGLFGCGVIDNLVPDPEDTSLWTGTGPWTNVVTVGTGIHMLSTDLDGATVSITAGTATIDGPASATYGNPDNFEVTGAGTVTIQTDTANPKAQITATTYLLPYVNGLSPENYSDADQGSKFPIDDMPQLLDALDGVADGTIISIDTDFSSGGYQAAGGAILDNGFFTTSGAGGPYKDFGLIFDQNYEIDIADSVPTGMEVYYGDPDNIGLRILIGNGPGKHRFQVANADYTALYFRYPVVGTVIINSAQYRTISPAQGKLFVEGWRPMFSAGDITGTHNILTASDDAGAPLYFDADNNLLKLTDGVNTSQIACSPVADTAYDITANFDTDTGMQISLDGVAGSLVPFVGRFPNADKLSPHWGITAPQYIKHIDCEKEPEW